MKDSAIYPVFLPHAGCPYQCIYCNQYAVTGMPSSADGGEELPVRIRDLLEKYFETARGTGPPGEIAFYGGTFTALDVVTIRRILDVAVPWVLRGRSTGIRFSTRPDGLSEEICSLLAGYPIRTVELGVQSLSDDVLRNARRGYSEATVERSAAMVTKNGWDLGLQLMAGLPGDTAGLFLESVVKTIRLRPTFVRLYPTLVLEGTLLAEWFRRGDYRPLSLEEAVEWCVPAMDVLHRAGIPVARMGLHAESELDRPGTVLAGPYHPAFGHMVRGGWWRRRVVESLKASAETQDGGILTIHVTGASVSEVVGHCRENVLHWQEKMGFEEVRVIGRPDWKKGHFECSVASANRHDGGGACRRRRRSRNRLQSPDRVL